jgi:8-oxo-dGTP diphosphatase
MSRDRFVVVVHVLLLRHRAAAEEVFLLRRAGTGFMDGFYVPPGGHQHCGESVADAARRECLEEAGVEPRSLVPLCVLPYRSGRHQGVNFVFRADAGDGQPGRGEPDHTDHCAWFPLDCLPQAAAPWLNDAVELKRSHAWFRELDYS